MPDGIVVAPPGAIQVESSNLVATLARVATGAAPQTPSEALPVSDEASAASPLGMPPPAEADDDAGIQPGRLLLLLCLPQHSYVDQVTLVQVEEHNGCQPTAPMFDLLVHVSCLPATLLPWP